MNLKPDEISELIKEQIKNYSHNLEVSDFGTVYAGGRRYCQSIRIE